MKAFHYSRMINGEAYTRYFTKKSFLLFAGCTIMLYGIGQDKKHLLLADQYFVAGEYLTAAGLYNQYLSPVVKEIPPSGFPLNSKKGSSTSISYSNNTDIQFKQAESYRLANYWNEAADLYLKCYQKDAVKYATALYWYAVAQRSLGQYAQAEESIQQFLSITTDLDFKRAAVQELGSLQFIKSQLLRPDSVLFAVQRIELANEKHKGVFAPIAIGTNRYLITSTQTDSVTIPGVNPNHNRLFYSVLKNGQIQNIEPLLIEGLDASGNQGAATVSADGNYLYFTQWKKEKGQSTAAIYFATKNGAGWSQPILLPSINESGSSSKQPFCSANGKYLFFASDRKGGQGKFDIWWAPILADGTTGEPVNAGPQLNTADNEQAPFYHRTSESLVFSSDRALGMGGYDLFKASGKELAWEQPENMGYPVNSSRDDVYFFAPDDGALLRNAVVSTDRGGDCCLNAIAITKAEKNKRLSGVVRDCETNELIPAAELQIKDAEGKINTLITDSKGQYLLDITGAPEQYQMVGNKEAYIEKISTVSIERIHTSGWLIDTLQNAPLCLEKKLVIKVENVVTVYFDFDRSQLKDRSKEQMDSIYTILQELPAATVQISGYTDGRGSAAYNKILSDKRAKACADYLIDKGIDATRISFESFGSCCPVEMELINGRDNPDGRSSNRRALINIKRD